jgi:hypothetical protein
VSFIIPLTVLQEASTTFLPLKRTTILQMLPSLTLSNVMVGLAVAMLLALRSPFIFSPTHDDRTLPVMCASTVAQGYNRENNSDFPGECFFADNYDDARAQFLTFAGNVGAELHTLDVGTGGDLKTDVAIIRRSKEKVIVHISGTHGVEGFAGSAVQTAALHQLSRQPEDVRSSTSLPTLVFVHVLNPYGMKYNRRVNEVRGGCMCMRSVLTILRYYLPCIMHTHCLLVTLLFCSLNIYCTCMSKSIG